MGNFITNSNQLISNGQPNKESIPWWLFLNILALDAPIVAIVWQHFLAENFKIVITISETASLFFTVWFIYLLDHFFDSQKGFYTTQRHLFVARNQKTTIALITFTLTTSICLCFSLSKPLIIGGLILLVFICIYLLLVHASVANIKLKNNCKELLVGIGFGSGVALPIIISNIEINTWLPAVLLFCLLCWLNCRLIDIWESNRNPLSKIELVLILFVFYLIFICQKPILITALITLVCLILINKFAGSKKPEISRVLADVSLLSPLIFWFYQ
jgi:hypothetical protein